MSQGIGKPEEMEMGWWLKQSEHRQYLLLSSLSIGVVHDTSNNNNIKGH